jgi:hypothetical protein
MEKSREFFSKLAGVTHKYDGVDPQRLLQRCKSGQELKLVRDPDNQYDKNAIKVCLLTGEQLGWIDKDVAARDLAKEIDRGDRIKVVISDVTGGTQSKPDRGCNIRITNYGMATVRQEPRAQATDEKQSFCSKCNKMVVPTFHGCCPECNEFLKT